MTIVRQIYKRLFRLYAHIYCAHSDRIRSIGASAHLNTTFKHLYLFIREFDLVSKQEMQPLQKLIDKFTNDQLEAQGGGAAAAGSGAH
jgi:MOB kinase activator 1